LIVFYLIIFIYCFSILYLAVNFSITENDTSSKKQNKTVSILIPFKNEAHNLKSLLNNLINQNYPKEKLEIIFIDDNSTDAGNEIIKNFTQKYKYIKSTLSKEQGKKNALKLGVQQSTAEIIIHTDADVSLNKNWVNSIVNNFNDEKTLLSFGSVVFEYNSFFAKLQSLELISLSGIAASTAIIKHPILISGANLAYRKHLKQTFVESINNIASGDDMFFLEKVKKKYPNSIKYIKDTNNIVKTNTARNIKSLINQRIRWAGKTRKMKDLEIILTGLLSFLSNSSIIIISISYVWNNNIILILSAVIIKFFTEFMALFIYSKHFNQRELIVFFPILFFIYPVYIISIASFSLFLKPRWK